MKNNEQLTHAYCHWLADLHLAGFSPAFTLSQDDSERSSKPPNANSLGRCAQLKNKKQSISNFMIYDLD
ncbi:MAG TPA: hypothetical protein VFC67_04695 [Prolixibacteraceae bacterium]|nr:hypothetical protein [Prolixibacteraceae bacterium]